MRALRRHRLAAAHEADLAVDVDARPMARRSATLCGVVAADHRVLHVEVGVSEMSARG
jgi:hypothetical protein